MHFVQAKSILSAQNGMNIYRGCSHGCIYCDSRSKCYGFTHEFEDIEVKENAPALLEQALKSRRRPCMIATGSMSDPYQPLELQLGLTRRCLALIERYGFGATVLTKSTRVLRDLDLLKAINQKTKAVVQMTLTTYDEALCRIVEPRVETTAERARALRVLRDEGIPTVVWLTPMLPFINDTEENVRGLMELCAGAGVKGVIHFGMGLTLREGDREYFYAALDRHFPGLKAKYIERYGMAYELPSPNDRALRKIVHEACAAHGMMEGPDECFRYLSELPEKYEQTSLF